MGWQHRKTAEAEAPTGQPLRLPMHMHIKGCCNLPPHNRHHIDTTEMSADRLNEVWGQTVAWIEDRHREQDGGALPHNEPAPW